MNNEVVAPEESSPVLEDIVKRLHEGKTAKDELGILKPAFAYALSKLERKQLRIRAEDMEHIGETYTLQAKSDGAGGIVLRSVRVL